MDAGDLPRSARRVWRRSWADAVGRPEIEAGLDSAPTQAGLEADVGSDFAGEVRTRLLSEVSSETMALRETIVERRVAIAVFLAGLLAVLAIGGGLVWLGAKSVVGVNEALPELLAVLVGSWVTGALVPSTRTMIRAAGNVRRARRNLREAIVGLLVPHLRRRINTALEVRFGSLDVRYATGLSETVDPSLEVQTAARSDLTRWMGEMRSGTLGVSGSRGAGKSTLIRAACSGRLTPEGRPRTVGVAIAAPVRWQASEFVPHLFAELCVAVAPRLRERRRPDRQVLRDMLVALAALAGAVALAVLAWTTWEDDLAIPSRDLDALALGLAAVLVGVVGLVAYVRALRGMTIVYVAAARVRRRTGARFALDWARLPLAATAEQCLRELRFRETVVKGWSVDAKGPLGFLLGHKRELTRTQQPLTLPEVVERYKAFVRRVAEERTLVIGIDELDKMESAEEAAHFLRDVKVLFGEQPCFYLVSISDDAMSEFERRGVPLRTVFDSTFDDVLNVETLWLEEAHAIVKGRVVGMGDGHVALCHVLGNGVPRELIRYVRGAVALARDGRRSLPAVSQALVFDRLRRLERAASSVAARHAAVDGRNPLLDWLQALPPLAPATLAQRWKVAEVHATLAARAFADDERARHQQLLIELAAVAYRAATVLLLWEDGRRLERLARTAAFPELLALLAQAGRDLALGPHVAWDAVNRARVEMARLGVEVAREPFPVAPTDGSRNGARWHRRVVAKAVQ